ncbi:MAG TPA: AAA family ATPase [Pseudonocardiaceae bacterium]|jgi:Mrp family chromosome partitioning ATPase|nr:AAA family ATPase [Pseudonocardiaceae bacterium]
MNSEASIGAAQSPARAALVRANTWYAMAASLVEVGKVARNRWREWHNYTVSITSEDSRYQDVHDWLLQAMPATKLRALAVRSDEEIGHIALLSDDEPTTPDRLFTTYDSAQEQTIDIGSYSVRITVEHGADDGQSRRAPRDKIVFRCTSQEGQQAVVAQLRTLIGTHEKRIRPPQLWMLSNWGTWQRRSDLPRRTPESVVLRDGQMESLTADLSAFLDREAGYVRRGIPWHRGYLLQGPPGTGKTSVAKALATQFSLDLWYAPLGDLSKDANLLSLLSEVRPRSLLLLEDIDIYHAATTREAESGRVTLSGLLNALDGVATPHGLITVLTSNEPKALDDALVRPGRVDRVEDIDYVTEEQARRLFGYFYGQPPTAQWRVDVQTSTADLTEVFKRHMDDPDGAERALKS